MNNIINRELKILELITDIYILVIIIFFPLSVNNTGYFNILEHKWHTFLFLGIIYIISIIIILLYYEIIKKTKYIRTIKLDKVKSCIIIYLLINIISCFISPYFEKYNLFVGVGRGEGLIMITLYCLSFILVSTFGKFKKSYCLCFSISSILVSFIGILQFCGFNPLNLYQQNIGIYNVSFVTTIGNVDFVSAYYTLYIMISFGTYVFLENNTKVEKIIHIISLILSIYIFSLIDVQSGRVGIFCTIILLIPFIITDNRRLSKFINVLSCLMICFFLNMIIGTQYDYTLNKFLFNIKINYITLLYILAIFILLSISKLISKKEFSILNNKKLIKSLYLYIIFFAIIGLIILYLFDFKTGIFYEIHEILNGNLDDKFGTYRIFLWKRTIKMFNDFPILGSGPDTFAIRFMAQFTNDIMAIGPLTINDTAANVYLTILINSGLMGVISYIFFLFGNIIKSLKNFSNYSIILTSSVVCYMIQDFFNLSLVIISPLFWVSLGIQYLTSNKELNQNKN